MAYPQYVKIRGEKVKIKTDYRTALRCFDVINNEDISDCERSLAVIFILYGYIPEDELLSDYLNMAQKFLQCGESIETQQEKTADMDFNFDRKYINASFMSDYHIDLEQSENMHFWQYCELIQGLTDGSILSRVRYIRNCDIKDYAQKDRAAVIKAKEELALPVKQSKEEREAVEIFEARLRGEL